MDKPHEATYEEAREFMTLLQQLSVEQQVGLRLILDGVCLLDNKKSGKAAKSFIRP